MWLSFLSLIYFECNQRLLKLYLFKIMRNITWVNKLNIYWMLDIYNVFVIDSRFFSFLSNIKHVIGSLECIWSILHHLLVELSYEHILHIDHETEQTKSIIYMSKFLRSNFLLSNFDIYLERGTNQLISKNPKRCGCICFYYARMWILVTPIYTLYLRINYKIYRCEISPKHLTNHHFSTITLDYQLIDTLYLL